MRVVLQGHGKLTIDVVGTLDDPARRNVNNLDETGRYSPDAMHPGFELQQYASLEEALFAGSIFLLQQHYARTGTIPTRNMAAAARQVFEVLVERGDLPASGSADTAFLAKLLAILEQITDDSGKPFFTGLIAFVRELIVDVDESDAGEEDGSPDDEEQASLDDWPTLVKKPGGNNGTPSNGSSQ